MCTTPEFARADSVCVRFLVGLKLLVAEGRIALTVLHAGIAKRGTNSLHMQVEFGSDLLLCLPVAVCDNDGERG